MDDGAPFLEADDDEKDDVEDKDDVKDKDDVEDRDDVEDKDDDAAIIEGEKGHCFGCRAAPSLICAALQSRSDY